GAAAALRGAGSGASAGAGAGAASGGARAGHDGASAPRATGPQPVAMPSREAISPLAGPRPYTSWPGVPDPYVQQQAQQDTEMFDVLRQLLAGRRALLGKLGGARPGQKAAPSHVVSPQDVQGVLGQLQLRPPA